MPKFCENCGAPLGNAKNFCGDCGAPIPQTDAEMHEFDVPAVPLPKVERTCARCGAILPEDALYCEQCSQSVCPQSIPHTWLRYETIREINRKYNPLWLLLILFLAIVLFALPESMLATGIPALLQNPAVWVAALIAFCILVWLDFYLERKAALKKLGVRAEDIGLFGVKGLGSASRRRSGEFRFNILFSVLAVLALTGVSLFGPGADNSLNPLFPGSPDRDRIAVTAKPGETPDKTAAQVTQSPEKKTLSLDGVWLPYEETGQSSSGGGTVDGVTVPNLVSINPSLLFQNGHMFMGIGESAEDIYEYSCNDHSGIAGYEGYPFTFIDGNITISDPYTSYPDRTWTIDENLIIYINDTAAFVPSDGARIVE